MKRILILILLSQPFRVFAQDAEIIAFCEKNLGKKVGGGICQDLPFAIATEVVGLEDEQEVYNKKRRVKRPKAGDIVRFDGTTVRIGGKNQIINHVAVVKCVEEDRVYFYHQNENGSPVKIGYFEPEFSNMKYISYIRLRKN